MSRISLLPQVRMSELAERLEEVKVRDSTSPCGSFTFAYHCMCDYHGVPFSEEIAWVSDVELCLLDVLFMYIKLFSQC